MKKNEALSRMTTFFIAGVLLLVFWFLTEEAGEVLSKNLEYSPAIYIEYGFLRILALVLSVGSFILGSAYLIRFIVKKN